jgi:hypothetical protein
MIFTAIQASSDTKGGFRVRSKEGKECNNRYSKQRGSLIGVGVSISSASDKGLIDR